MSPSCFHTQHPTCPYTSVLSRGAGVFRPDGELPPMPWADFPLHRTRKDFPGRIEDHPCTPDCPRVK